MAALPSLSPLASTASSTQHHRSCTILDIYAYIYIFIFYILHIHMFIYLYIYIIHLQSRSIPPYRCIRLLFPHHHRLLLRWISLAQSVAQSLTVPVFPILPARTLSPTSTLSPSRVTSHAYHLMSTPLQLLPVTEINVFDNPLTFLFPLGINAMRSLLSCAVLAPDS